MMSHQRALRDAHVLIAKGLSPNRHRQLRDHLRGCDDCLRQYERLRGVEDALSPGGLMAPTAFERMGELVLADIGPQPRRAGFGWMGAFSAAAALAVVVLMVLPRPDNDFTSRGVTGSEPSHGLSLFLIDPVSRRAERAAVDGQRVAVPAGRLVQLAYRTTDDTYLVVVGVDAHGEAQLYVPKDGVRLVPGAVDEPLPGAWNLDEVATPLRLFAFFGKAPIDSQAVLEAAKGGGTPATFLIDVAKR